MPSSASKSGASGVLPEKYDVRSGGLNLGVKDQGNTDYCWAYAAATVLEGKVSPDEPAVFDPLHFAKDQDSDGAGTEGGNYRTIMAYLAGERGPVSDPECDSPILKPESVRLLQNRPVRELKEELKDNGPLQASISMTRDRVRDSSYYNKETFAWYDPDHEKAEHDIVILGWDDDFPASSFLESPEEDGAWICQNSWGSTFGDGGVFYISYEDVCVGSRVLSYRMRVSDPEEHLYQTDYRGWQGKQGYDREECWFANVYEASGSEVLSAVGFYATGDDTAYSAYLVRDFQDTISLGKREYLLSGKLDNAGYYRVDLIGSSLTEEERMLKEGESFAVVIRIETPGSKRPVAVEMKKADSPWGIDLDHRGYLSADGETWEFAELLYETNVCLKCYTHVLE